MRRWAVWTGYLPIQPGVLVCAQAFCTASFCAVVGGVTPHIARGQHLPHPSALPRASTNPTLLAWRQNQV
eukprot:3939275-Amphidinium_carterae.1